MGYLMPRIMDNWISANTCFDSIASLMLSGLTKYNCYFLKGA